MITFNAGEDLHLTGHTQTSRPRIPLYVCHAPSVYLFRHRIVFLLPLHTATYYNMTILGITGRGFAPRMEQYRHRLQIHANLLRLFRAFATATTYSATRAHKEY